MYDLLSKLPGFNATQTLLVVLSSPLTLHVLVRSDAYREYCNRYDRLVDESAVGRREPPVRIHSAVRFTCNLLRMAGR